MTRFEIGLRAIDRAESFYFDHGAAIIPREGDHVEVNRKEGFGRSVQSVIISPTAPEGEPYVIVRLRGMLVNDRGFDEEFREVVKSLRAAGWRQY